jgi:glutathione S-transferase
LVVFPLPELPFRAAEDLVGRRIGYQILFKGTSSSNATAHRKLADLFANLVAARIAQHALLAAVQAACDRAALVHAGCAHMIKLYDSAFSPFARKVRMVLEHKGLDFEAVDGLLKSNHDALKAVNGRIEVPVLVDGDLVVVNSADIVGYLEFRYPANPVYPEEPAARVHARAWERAADAFIDAILIDVSYWKWADRQDKMPDGLLEAARSDLGRVYDALDRNLAQREFVSGPLSIADIALFPHMASVKAMEVEFSAQDHPNLARWFKQMRALPICAADLRRARDFVVTLNAKDFERRRIFWRGDRIEWLLARGYHDWFFNEIAQARVAWPGPALPAPLNRQAGGDTAV